MQGTATAYPQHLAGRASAGPANPARKATPRRANAGPNHLVREADILKMPQLRQAESTHAKPTTRAPHEPERPKPQHARRGQRQGVHRAAYLAIAATLVLGVVLLALGITPRAALAADESVRATTQRDAYAGGSCSHISGDQAGRGTGGYTGYANAWMLEDGTIAYCASTFAHGGVTAGDWASFHKANRADAVLSYIVAHGYPQTNVIGGTEFANGDARLATAFAVWIYTGDSLTTSSKTAPLYEAAQRLVDEARTNGDAEWEKNQYWVYEPDSGDLQSLIIAPETGSLTLRKANSQPSLTINNPNYSLAGAEYGVYDDEACNSLVGTLVTTEDGSSNTLADLKAATYYVRELKASPGFALDAQTHAIEVRPNETACLEVTELPQHNPIELVIAKLDAETGKASPLGAASLTGAEFRVSWSATGNSAQDGSESRAWTLKTDEKGEAKLDSEHLVAGDDFFLGPQGQITLPLGTLTIEETKAPEGYLKLEGMLSTQRIAAEGTSEILGCLQTTEAREQVTRGDVRLVKVDEESMERLGGIAFRISSKTTSESHVAVTDENGHIDTRASWTSHCEKTNANDAALSEDGKIDDSKLDADAGIWFYGSAEQHAEPNDELGALPYDSYRVEELRCAANAGRRLLSFDLVVTRDSTTLDLGTIDNAAPPSIGTTLTDATTKTHEAKAAEKLTLVDEVSYEGLTPGKTYVVTGKLMVRESAKPLLNAEGNEVTGTATFCPDSPNGSVNVAFEFDASKLAGTSLVAFETLEADGELVATHEDIDDEGQTVLIVEGEEPPGTPEEPEEPGEPEEPQQKQRMPQTGENPSIVLGALLVGAASLGTGLVIVRRKG